MEGRHLSELCSKDEVDPIYHYLRQIAPETVEWVDIEGNKCDDGVIQYVSGVWGFRDGDGRTAFHWAVALRNYSLANTLMNEPYRSPVLSEDEDGVTPFMTACMVGAPEKFVRSLLEKSVAVYNFFLKCPVLQRRPLKEGSKANGDRGQKADRNLYSSGANIGHGDMTTEDVLSTSNEAPICEEFVAKYNIVNSVDSLGNTALLHVASRGHSHLVDFLIRNGSELNHQNKHGQSALHRAVGRGNMNTVEILLCASKQKINKSKEEHQRWVNLQDVWGNTALFYASMENNEDLGRLLLRNGADRYLRNKEGKEFWEV
ncbi:unnamed protein product [Phytomonas sp. EM1]|nr:unnamed protein product [Phytomonas sp. EM1]|eukprot:CCW64949.1 unnamed protein product [Phytomonas sp. isolate EM1]